MLIQLPKLLLIQKTQRVKTKYLILQVLLQLQNLIGFGARIKKVAKKTCKQKSSRKYSSYSKQKQRKKFQASNLSYFLDKSYFVINGMQNYLLFQPAFKYFKTPSTKSNQIIAWKSNGLSEEYDKSSTTSNKSLAPGMTFLVMQKLSKI